MATHSDVIVVGAGLGGLSAAAHIARAGLSVHVFERHVQPGGYATTFLRGGYEFEASLHELSGIGRPGARGPLWRILEELGVTDRVDFIDIPNLYRSVGPGLDVVIPADPKGATDALCQAFPKERRGIRRVLGDILAIHDEISAMGDIGGKLSAPAALARFPRLTHAATVSFGQVLYREITDPMARCALGQLWGYFGLPPSRLSYVYYAAGLASYLNYGASYPRGKSQMLANAFMDVIEEAGGHVHLSRGVRRILTENDRVTGIIDDRDEHFTTNAVVSNADPMTTAVDLIGVDIVPKAYLQRLSTSRPSLSSFTTYLVLDGTPSDLGLTDHEMFINSEVDIEAQYRASLDIVAPKSLSVTTYSVIDSDFVPAGKSSVALTVLVDGAPWAQIDPADYPVARTRLAQQTVEQVERVAPGFSDRIETAVIATPLTNMRYTGNRGGSLYGFEQTPADNPIWRVGPRGPFKGLWLAGAWTRPGGGYEPSIESGRSAARRVIAELKGRPRASGKTRSKRRHHLLSRPSSYVPLVRDFGSVVRSIAQHALRTKLAESPSFTRGSVSTIVQKFHPRRVDMRVVEVRDETPSTRTFRLTPLAGRFAPFEAGQYVNLYLDIDGVQTSRPYSVSSPPGRLSTIDLTIRRVFPGFVGPILMDRLKPGEVVTVSGPEGDFFHNPLVDTSELVLIAGGSGISPFRSMIEDTLGRGRELDITLLYGSRDADDVIFRERLQQLAKRHPERFRMALVISEPTEDWKGERGLLDRACVERHVPKESLARKTFFVCGPPEMCRLVEDALDAMGVPKRRVHVEAFGPPARVTEEQGWPSELSADTVFEATLDDDERIPVRADEPLLTSLERAGRVIPTLCRAGTCGTCRLRLVRGEVYTPSRVAVRQSDRIAGYILPCMSYPLSDVTLKLP